MSGEETLITTHNQGDYGACECTEKAMLARATGWAASGNEHSSPPNGRTIQSLLYPYLRMLAINLPSRLDRFARAILRWERTLEHFDRGGVCCQRQSRAEEEEWC